MDKDGQQTTLRDQLAAAFDNTETPETVETPVKSEVIETSEQKAERIRDEQGRFAKQEQKQEVKNVPRETEIKTEVKTEVKRPPRPSSWKKEMWDHWEKLDPHVAEYLNQREQDFAKGVSTYKQEWESAKPLLDVMAQFQPILEQNGIKPEQWINNLGNAHKLLAMGSPEQKLSMFVKLAQDYQVPLQGLFTRGQDGQVYLNPQIQAWQAPQAQPQSDPRQLVEEILDQRMADQEVRSFASNTDQYPHFEQVKDTMAGLLQAGLAPDLKSAYDAALRMPHHADLFDELQRQQQAKAEQEKRDKLQRETSGAKAKAVSLKTSTPVGTSTKGERKGLRAQLEEAADEHLSGRV